MTSILEAAREAAHADYSVRSKLKYGHSINPKLDFILECLSVEGAMRAYEFTGEETVEALDTRIDRIMRAGVVQPDSIEARERIRALLPRYRASQTIRTPEIPLSAISSSEIAATQIYTGDTVQGVINQEIIPDPKNPPKVLMLRGIAYVQSSAPQSSAPPLPDLQVKTLAETKEIGAHVGEMLKKIRPDHPTEARMSEDDETFKRGVQYAVKDILGSIQNRLDGWDDTDPTSPRFELESLRDHIIDQHGEGVPGTDTKEVPTRRPTDMNPGDVDRINALLAKREDLYQAYRIISENHAQDVHGSTSLVVASVGFDFALEDNVGLRDELVQAARKHLSRLWQSHESQIATIITGRDFRTGTTLEHVYRENYRKAS